LWSGYVARWAAQSLLLELLLSLLQLPESLL
jgi:hypothetical protein